MVAKEIPIPLYFGKLILIKTDDFKKVNKVYKTKAKNKLYDAVVFETIKRKHHVVAIKVVDWSIIAHETVHLVNDIFLKCGIQLDRVNDEPQAYLTGWIVSEIDKFLKEQVTN
jgi:hypothetical protein